MRKQTFRTATAQCFREQIAQKKMLDTIIYGVFETEKCSLHRYSPVFMRVKFFFKN